MPCVGALPPGIGIAGQPGWSQPLGRLLITPATILARKFKAPSVPLVLWSRFWGGVGFTSSSLAGNTGVGTATDTQLQCARYGYFVLSVRSPSPAVTRMGASRVLVSQPQSFFDFVSSNDSTRGGPRGGLRHQPWHAGRKNATSSPCASILMARSSFLKVNDGFDCANGSVLAV